MVALISRLGACVPVYDFHTARKYAEVMLNAQIILCACGSLSWAFGGVASLTFGFALLAHVGLEVAKPKLLKMYTVSQFALLLLDVIWLSLWARRIDRGAVRARESSRDTLRNWNCLRATRGAARTRRNLNLARTNPRRLSDPLALLPTLSYAYNALVPSKQDGIFANAHYHGAPRFLLGMQVLLFLSRPLVIMTWCKMWDLNFGSADAANPYGQMEDAMPAPPPAAPPAGGAGYAGGGDGYKPQGVPDGNPSLGQGGGAYVPPAAARQ